MCLWCMITDKLWHTHGLYGHELEHCQASDGENLVLANEYWVRDSLFQKVPAFDHFDVTVLSVCDHFQFQLDVEIFYMKFLFTKGYLRLKKCLCLRNKHLHAFKLTRKCSALPGRETGFTSVTKCAHNVNWSLLYPKSKYISKCLIISLYSCRWHRPQSPVNAQEAQEKEKTERVRGDEFAVSQKKQEAPLCVVLALGWWWTAVVGRLGRGLFSQRWCVFKFNFCCKLLKPPRSLTFLGIVFVFDYWLNILFVTKGFDLPCMA